MRLVSHYLPPDQITSNDLLELSEKPIRGTTAYYAESVGGARGLAQLYLEAGLLHLEGAASTLLAASYSSLSSIRIPLHGQIGEGGAAAWRRDREAAAKFFDSARALYPGLDIPALPSEGELELEMPAMNLGHSASDTEPSKEEFLTDSEPDATLRRRRKALEKEQALLDKGKAGLDEMEGPWYLYVPGIVGAGTALLVVGIVGALSFSTWSRRNQGS
jgi:thiamine pyrophosphokinase